MLRGGTVLRDSASRGACHASGSASRGAYNAPGAARRGAGALPRKAAVVAAGGGAGRRPAKALTGRCIAVSDALTVHRVVLPRISGDDVAVGVDPVELV
jgi:hypothetical protein